MVNNKKARFFIINLVVIICAAYLFLTEYKEGIFVRPDKNILIPVAAVLIVHIIKAIRLYLAMYGENIGFSEYLKIYFKVTPVSMIFPCKIGELYRMYCYGTALFSMPKGVILVLLDRFMDTMALVSMLLIGGMLGGKTITVFTYLLVIFIVLAFLIYILFPGLYTFWKKYFLRANATAGKLTVLRFLDSLNKIYQEIKAVTRGRGLMLYLLSLMAWGIEIGTMVLSCRIKGADESVTEYLLSAIGIGTSAYLWQFVMVSVIMLVTIYLIVSVIGLVHNSRERHDESNSGI